VFAEVFELRAQKMPPKAGIAIPPPVVHFLRTILAPSNWWKWAGKRNGV